MADIERTADAVWRGDLRSGMGKMNSGSGAIKDQSYSYKTRFENEPGTNPEELIAAAHASCFSMALAGALTKAGFQPEEIFTKGTCILTPKPEGGFRIAGMRLDVRGKVPAIDQARFEEIAHQTDENGCPVSVLLHPGLTVELNAVLET